MHSNMLVQDADIGDAFFDALGRVGHIHKSCRSLLNSHHHRAGLELMDAMSSYQENAYERLCRHASPLCATQSDFANHAVHECRSNISLPIVPKIRNISQAKIRNISQAQQVYAEGVSDVKAALSSLCTDSAGGLQSEPQH